MVTLDRERASSIRKSSLIGTAIGTGVLLLYLVTGLLSGSWNVGDFLSKLTLETVGSLLLLCGLVVATFAIPIVLYLHYRIVAPLGLLVIVVIGWLAYGVISGIIGAGAIFGLGLYAIGLSPLYVVLYLLLGGAEYHVRRQGFR